MFLLCLELFYGGLKDDMFVGSFLMIIFCRHLLEDWARASGVAPSRLLTIWTEMFPSDRLTLGPDRSLSSSDTS